MGTGEDESNKAPDESHFHAVPELFLLKAGSPEPHSLMPAADHPIAPKSKVSQTGRAGFGCLPAPSWFPALSQELEKSSLCPAQHHEARLPAGRDNALLLRNKAVGRRLSPATPSSTSPWGLI